MDSGRNESKKPFIKSCELSVGRREGPHIVALSVLSMPIVFLCALCATGYMGVLTWYNVFLHYFDDRTLFHRLTICPLLILFFPPILLILTLILSVYVTFDQLSWRLEQWLCSVRDLEKGFFGRACAKIGLADCCPYEVIILQEDDSLELAAEDVGLKGVIAKSDTSSSSTCTP